MTTTPALMRCMWAGYVCGPANATAASEAVADSETIRRSILFHLSKVGKCRTNGQPRYGGQRSRVVVPADDGISAVERIVGDQAWQRAQVRREVAPTDRQHRIVLYDQVRDDRRVGSG